MLTVTVELLHGTIRAGSPDDTVMAGGAEGEWPPSPARLFSALVAGDGTRDRCEVTTGDGFRWLEAQAPPVIHASPSEDVLTSASRPRFVVVDSTNDGAVQDYPARTSREVRPGPRQAPRDTTISYVWPDAAPPPDAVAGLEARAARVGYLGCADSPVRVVVSDSPTDRNREPCDPTPRRASHCQCPIPGSSTPSTRRTTPGRPGARCAERGFEPPVMGTGPRGGGRRQGLLRRRPSGFASIAPSPVASWWPSPRLFAMPSWITCRGSWGPARRSPH